jgi:predicted dehydrogenase
MLRHALVVGLGGVGQRHVRNLRRLCGAGLRITAHRVRKREQVLTDHLEVEPGRDLCAAYDLQVEDDLGRALAQAPDAVFICNPSRLHMPVALAAARAGCALFVEKPLSHSWEGVDELIETVARRGLVGLVGYQMRFHPCLRGLREVLDRRLIGRVVGVRVQVGDYLPAWHPYEDYRHLYASRRDLGGGVILTQSHELDYVCWLFGLPVRVCAMGGHLGSLEIDVEDTASLLMECVVDGRTVPVHVHQDYVRRPPARTCEVIGEAGTVTADFHAPSVRVTDARGVTVEDVSFDAFARNDMFLDEMTHFLACVRGEAMPVVTIAEGARSLRLALAARESLDTGRVVELP